MITLLRRWWRPTEFIVTYFNEPECESFDKVKCWSLAAAEVRMEYLAGLEETALLQEGVHFIPHYFRILQITAGNPLRRLLNRLGSTRMYRILGIWI